MKFSSFVIPAITAIIASYLYTRTARLVPPQADGKTLLKLPKYFLIIGILGFLMVTAVLIGCLFFDDVDNETMPLIPTIILFAIQLLSLYTIFLAKNHYVLFNDTILEVRNSMGKVRTVEWATLKECDYKLYPAAFKLKEHSGVIVYVSFYNKGINQFLHMLEAKTKWSRACFPIKRGPFSKF